MRNKNTQKRRNVALVMRMAELGYNGRDLAKVTGLSEMTISELIHCKRPHISLVTAFRISDALQSDVRTLFARIQEGGAK